MRFIKCQSIVFGVINHGYDVHHKNEIKTDNRLENLCYLTREEHTKLHKIGKKHSEQSKAKMSVVNKGKKRKPLSDEHKAKLSAAKQKKQVYCVQLDKVFEGINIAAQELSLHVSSISQCCNGKLKTTGGYHFQFQNV